MTNWPIHCLRHRRQPTLLHHACGKTWDRDELNQPPVNRQPWWLLQWWVDQLRVAPSPMYCNNFFSTSSRAGQTTSLSLLESSCKYIDKENTLDFAIFSHYCFLMFQNVANRWLGRRVHKIKFSVSPLSLNIGLAKFTRIGIVIFSITFCLVIIRAKKKILFSESHGLMWIRFSWRLGLS
jgi:hypothetical protein